MTDYELVSLLLEIVSASGVSLSNYMTGVVAMLVGGYTVAHRLDRVGHCCERDGEDDEFGAVSGSTERYGGKSEGFTRGRDLVARRVAGGESDVMAEIDELPGQVGADDAGADDGDRKVHGRLRR